MKMWKNLAGGVALGAIAAGFVQPALAQTTTSSVGGSIDLADGAPAAGAQVVLTDTRTGLSRTSTTSASGAFGFQGLNVGGPYTIDVTMAGQQPIKLTDLSIALGAPTSVNLEFSGSAGADVVVITGTSASVAQVATGPAASFTLETLEHATAINNDVKDILKLDPRIYLDESFGGPVGNDGIQCGGAHPRFTSLTLDGVTMSDGFGVSANNYPSERMPFPFEAINQISAELAPFSVLYGGFTGCNINAVTKSGSNSFHGSVYFDYTNNGLRSHRTQSPLTRIQTHQKTDRVPDFDEKRYSATLSGPIIKDRLFFFGAYEKAEFSNFFTRGQVGSGAPTVPSGLDAATFDAIIAAAKNKYGYDPGSTTLDSPQVDEKYLVRLDWNITDRHRAVFSYDHDKAFQLIESNTGNTSYEYSTHLYKRGGEFDAYNVQLFSDWTDNFSTELRFAKNDWDGTVRCQGGTQFGEMQITLSSGTNVYLGCDRSRQANDLNYSVTSGVVNGTYRLGDHTLLAGYELRRYDIFNLFLQNPAGTYTFSGSSGLGDGLTNFQNGLATTVLYGNSVKTNNVNDAAANFGYDIHTAYLQDTVTEGDFEVTAGVRMELYSSTDKSRFNPKFFSRYGFANTKNFDGLFVVQPRIGANWDFSPDLKFRAGVGLFSGGDPNVYLSNSYSNDGVTTLALTATSPTSGTVTTYGLPMAATNFTGATARAFDLFAPTATYVGDERSSPTVNPLGVGWGIPAGLFNTVGAASAQDNPTQAVDQDFQIPSAWKFDVGASWTFDLGPLGRGYVLNADWLYSKDRYTVHVIDLTLQRVGTAPDGQPVYRRIDKSNPACIANPGTVFAVSTTAGCSRTTSDLLLTNNPGGYQSVISFDLSKSYDFGLDWMIGYAHTDAKDRTPITSSTASSNYTNNTTADFLDLPLRNSNYEIPNRWTMQLSYKHAFFGDYFTRATLTGQAWQAKDYTFVYASFTGSAPDGAWGDNNSFAHPFYVPSGPGATDDPKVTYSSAFLAKNGPNGMSGLDELNRLIDTYHLPRGRTLDRNQFSGQWNNKFDLKLEQELPGGFGGAKASAFVLIENIGNMINSDWGQVYEASFPSRITTVATNINTSGQYVYQFPSGTGINASNNSLIQTTGQTLGRVSQSEALVAGASYWTVKIGAKYSF